VDASGPQLEPLPSRELIAFVAAVETGRLGAAADSLSLTQSAVTKRIQSLEQRLGTQLLERSHNGVSATPAGRALYPDAKEGLVAFSRAARSVHDDKASPDACLRLAASHTIGELLLPRWLAAFRIAVPILHSSVTVANSETVLAAVHEHHADIGLLPDPDRRAGLDSIRVGKDELVVVVGPHHRWTAANSVAPSQLRSETFFTREEGSGTRSLAHDALLHLGVELLPAVEVGSTEALKRMVLREGYTIISSLAIADQQAVGELHALSIQGVDLSRSLCAVKRRSSGPPPVARQFWAWLATLDDE
jgi:DNA-binding transcriptional LysR family regulator